MTIGSGVVLIAVCMALWAVIELAERVCGVLTVRRHKHDGLEDPRVLRSVRLRMRRLSAEETQDVGDGY